MTTEHDIVERLERVAKAKAREYKINADSTLDWEAAATITALRAERHRLVEKGFELIEERESRKSKAATAVMAELCAIIPIKDIIGATKTGATLVAYYRSVIARAEAAEKERDKAQRLLNMSLGDRVLFYQQYAAEKSNQLIAAEAELSTLREQLAKSEEANFVLSAGACVVKGGLLSGEGGSPYCTLREQLQEVRNNALEEAAKIADEAHRMRERLFNENGASINASKSVQAEEIAAAIRARTALSTSNGGGDAQG